MLLTCLVRFTLYKQVIVAKAFAAEKAWKTIFVQVPHFFKCFEWKVNSKSNVGSAEFSSHATPDVSLWRKWLNAVQTRSLDSQTLSDRVCTNSGSHGNGREKQREESEWEGGKREKKQLKERAKKIEKGSEREWLGHSVTCACRVLLPLYRPSTHPAGPPSPTNQRANLWPQPPSQPIKFSEFPSHYIMLSQRLNNIPSNRCSQTAPFPRIQTRLSVYI